MSDLNKKVNNAIKVMKMAEAAALDKGGKHLIINSIGGGTR